MCGLYGVLSYGNSIRNMDSIVKELAWESASRGTDATGYSYNHRGNLAVVKQSKSAYNMKYFIPRGVSAVMGHTRHATQGTVKNNENNHPFKGHAGKSSFTLAHNGIITNDGILRKSLCLPSPRIATDSYIAVQLLESRNRLDFDSIRYMAEKVKGSFSFTILDNRNNLYIVKGDSPIELLHFPKSQTYVYASTKSILWRAIVETELFADLQKRAYTEIDVQDGEILKITPSGKIQKSNFEFDCMSAYGLDWSMGLNDDFYIDEIKAVARCCGFCDEDIDVLVKEGFTPEEIEDMLYADKYAEV